MPIDDVGDDDGRPPPLGPEPGGFGGGPRTLGRNGRRVGTATGGGRPPPRVPVAAPRPLPPLECRACCLDGTPWWCDEEVAAGGQRGELLLLLDDGVGGPVETVVGRNGNVVSDVLTRAGNDVGTGRIGAPGAPRWAPPPGFGRPIKQPPN